MTGGSARRALFTVVGAVLVMTVVQLFHGSGLPLYKTLWAEDGPVFLQGALDHHSIFATHAGYAQFAPRLVAWGAARVSLDNAAIWFAIVAPVVTALLAAAVYWLSDFVVQSRLLRAVLAASFVLPPVLVAESLGNAANLQWPFLAACFWALARPAKTRREVSICGVIAVVAALSSSVALVYLPIAVLVFALRRERVTRVVPALFVAACVAQVVLTASASESAEQGPSKILDLPVLYLVRVVGSALLGERPLISAWVHLGVGIAVIVGVVAAAAIFVLFVRNDQVGRLWSGAAIVTSIVLFCATTYYRGTQLFHLPDGKWNPSGSRYAGCALQLLMAGVVVLVARARAMPSWRRAIVWVVAAQAVVAPAVTWRPETARSHGVQWRVELAAARRECDRARLPFVAVPITPEPRDWNVVIRCKALR